MAEGYDLFISEHTNAYNGTTRGVEVFYDFEKPYDRIYAEMLSKAVSDVMGNPNRGAKIRTFEDDEELTDDVLNYYGVIRNSSKTSCPYIFLIESGFHDNPMDEAFLLVDENLKKIARAQVDVIIKILNVEAHWAQKYKDSLESKGVTIYEDRFDDPITRGELFSLLDRIIK